MCVYSGTPYIYTPNMTNSESVASSILFYVLIINLALCILLEFILKYKTNLLAMVETMQILSYFIFFSVPLSETNQINLTMIYHFNPTALFQLYEVQPQGQQFTSSGKAGLLNKTGIFIYDTMVLHISLSIFILIFLVLRLVHNYKPLPIHKHINPYLISYPFRIVFMELFMCGVLFLTQTELTSPIDKGSLGFLIVDVLLIALSLFWKVRT